jgi:transposase
MPSDALPDDLETLKAMLFAERCESERLRQIIKELQRHRFGRRAETLPEDQMLLGLEDVEQVAAAGEAEQDETVPDGRAARARKRRSNRGALPAHLPRVEIVVDIDDKTCPCCQGELHRIGEDKSERLVPHHSDYDWLILSQFRMGRSSGATRIWMLRATPG